ncbi:hypothetical protein BDQ17DRAFT_674771 [Cyathus striatus]|nr:hypothetical protein BDQ17DRAFT_674771 [Cyathus striatus]
MQPIISVFIWKDRTSHNAGELAALLSHTPTLRELEVSHIEAADLQMLCLLPIQTHKPLVPSLTSLLLHSVSDRDLQLDLVSQLGLSRCDFSTKTNTGSIVKVDSHGCCRLEELAYRPYDNGKRIQDLEMLEGLTISYDPSLPLHPFWLDDSEPYCGARLPMVQAHLDTEEMEEFFMMLERRIIRSSMFFQKCRIHLHVYDLKSGVMQWNPNPKIWQKKADNLLKKWEPLLMRRLPTRTWAINRRIIQYVPKDSDIRNKKCFTSNIWTG